jgi:hypothetical protein
MRPCFPRTLLDLGCRVDESLDLYELGFLDTVGGTRDFLLVEGLSAVYRITRQSGFGVNAKASEAERAAMIIYRKWQDRLEGSDHQVHVVRSGCIVKRINRANKTATA